MSGPPIHIRSASPPPELVPPHSSTYCTYIQLHDTPMTMPNRDLSLGQVVVTEECTAQVGSVMPRLSPCQNDNTNPLISYSRLMGTTIPLFAPTIHLGLADPRPTPVPPTIFPASLVFAVWPTTTLDADLMKTAATENNQRLRSTNEPLKARSVPNSGSICRRDAALDPEAVGPNSVDTASGPPTSYRTAGRISRARTGRGNVLGIERAEDDAAIVPQLTRQVDYLSHDWKEVEIWSSWKYIGSQRPEDKNGIRLENALWRTWMKAKKELKAVQPEEINWYAELAYSFAGTETLALILFCSGGKIAT